MTSGQGGIDMTVYGKDFAALYNDKFRFWGPKMWPFLSQAVAKHNPEAKTWLDLCCGTGSLLSLVCDAGFDTVGVDRSSCQLKYAKQNAPRARLVLADIRELSLDGKVDVVTCMFDSLNYLTSSKDLKKVFRSVYLHLNRNGLFVFDMNTFEGLQDLWCRTSAIRETNRLTLVETSFDAKKALGRCSLTGFIQQGRVYRRFEETHIERGYHAAEIEDLLDQSGFGFKKFDGNYLSRPKIRSSRLLYLCNVV
jgi:SAM-dependent methyltransferase